MGRIFKTVLLIILIVTNIRPQNITEYQAKVFINAYLNQSEELYKFVLPSELKLSTRLGITYPAIKFKFLISNNLESSILTKLFNKSLKYNLKIDSLNKNYSVLKLEIPSMSIEREYYFYKSYLISRPYYYSKNWSVEKSKYFEFHVSDTAQFNKYSIKKLDYFVNKMIHILQFNKNEISKLKKEKIQYFLCKDENEFELLTGNKARGLYYLPYDYIITSFNCHHHEIMHLLMNYKLQTVPLYTLPVLQEGFAVAYGGRGGKEPDVILNMGLFLAQNKFVKIQALLSKSDFNQYDASLTYPISGLYVKFLIKSLGLNGFIKLYKKYSGDAERIDLIKIDTTELPSDAEWMCFLNRYKNNSQINVAKNDNAEFTKRVVKANDFEIYENRNQYLFKIKNPIVLTPKNYLENYNSELFNELFPAKTYLNEKYIIVADTNEVSIYNLYDNNLIAKYVRGFSLKNEPVYIKNSYFIFSVEKEIFDEPLGDLRISDIGN